MCSKFSCYYAAITATTTTNNNNSHNNSNDNIDDCDDKPTCDSVCHTAGLSLMPSSALVELLHRVEAAIREYSEELISQLARREELEFEKEVKNTFITALMEVQNRQKEQRDGNKRRRRDKALSLQGGTVDTVAADKTGSMPAKVRRGRGKHQPAAMSTTAPLRWCSLCILF